MSFDPKQITIDMTFRLFDAPAIFASLMEGAGITRGDDEIEIADSLAVAAADFADRVVARLQALDATQRIAALAWFDQMSALARNHGAGT